MRADACCPHNKFGGNDFASFHLHTTCKASCCWCIRSYFNSLACQATSRMGREFRMHSAKNIGARLQHQQSNFFCTNSAESFGDVPEKQVMPLCNEFYAGVAATYHDKCKQPPS